MRYFKVALLAFASILLLPPGGLAQDVREIMLRVRDRDDGDTQITRQKFSTCRYVIKNKKMACGETPRVKAAEGVRKDYGPNGQDSRSITIILKPPGERGIGFLQFDYEDPDHDSDQWMYLSALGKVRRIVSGNEDEPKSGSLFGSELNYEDVEKKHLDDYTYKIVKTTTYQKRPCWIIESRPTPERARKSNYSKSVSWIDQERYLTLRSLMYDRQGKKVKLLTMSGTENIDGVWINRLMNVNNLQTKRITSMRIESVAINVEVSDEFLTQRALTDNAFRERNLTKLRAEMK